MAAAVCLRPKLTPLGRRCPRDYTECGGIYHTSRNNSAPNRTADASLHPVRGKVRRDWRLEGGRAVVRCPGWKAIRSYKFIWKYGVQKYATHRLQTGVVVSQSEALVMRTENGERRSRGLSLTSSRNSPRHRAIAISLLYTLIHTPGSISTNREQGQCPSPGPLILFVSSSHGAIAVRSAQVRDAYWLLPGPWTRSRSWRRA